MNLACVDFTGVDSGSMGLVSVPDDEEWGFTSGVDGKDSILAAASTCSSSDELRSPSSCSPPSPCSELGCNPSFWRQFSHRSENFGFDLDSSCWRHFLHRIVNLEFNIFNIEID